MTRLYAKVKIKLCEAISNIVFVCQRKSYTGESGGKFLDLVLETERKNRNTDLEAGGSV